MPSSDKATLNTAIALLPRDAMRKRGLCCRPVYVSPSVCMSDTFVYYIQTAQDIVRLLTRPRRNIYLVFGTQLPVRNRKRNQPFSGDGEYTGLVKFVICD